MTAPPTCTGRTWVVGAFRSHGCSRVATCLIEQNGRWTPRCNYHNQQRRNWRPKIKPLDDDDGYP